jgi:hypothetical protein
LRPGRSKGSDCTSHDCLRARSAGILRSSDNGNPNARHHRLPRSPRTRAPRKLQRAASRRPKQQRQGHKPKSNAACQVLPVVARRQTRAGYSRAVKNQQSRIAWLRPIDQLGRLAARVRRVERNSSRVYRRAKIAVSLETSSQAHRPLRASVPDAIEPIPHVRLCCTDADHSSALDSSSTLMPSTGCSTETGSDAGKVSFRASSRAMSRRRRSRSPKPFSA